MRAASRRSRLLARVRALVERRGRPRTVVGAVMALAGGAAFLASFGLLHAGLSEMVVRWPAAAVVGYAVFLLGLRVAVGAMRRRVEEDPVDPLDALDIVSELGGDGAPAPAASDGPLEVVEAGGGMGDLLPDLDDGFALVVGLGILLAGLVAVFYTLAVAPLLIAELLVDAVLIASLARRFRHVESSHWLPHALRRTFLPFLGLLLTLALLGLLAQVVVPGADSIGDLLGSG